MLWQSQEQTCEKASATGHIASSFEIYVRWKVSVFTVQNFRLAFAFYKTLKYMCIHFKFAGICSTLKNTRTLNNMNKYKYGSCIKIESWLAMWYKYVPPERIP